MYLLSTALYQPPKHVLVFIFRCTKRDRMAAANEHNGEMNLSGSEMQVKGFHLGSMTGTVELEASSTSKSKWWRLADVTSGIAGARCG